MWSNRGASSSRTTRSRWPISTSEPAQGSTLAGAATAAPAYPSPALAGEPDAPPNTAGSTPAPLLPALAGFAFDLLLWLCLLAGGSVLGTVGWGFVQGLRGASAAHAGPPTSVSLLIGLAATAFSALIVYYFRRTANAVERRAAWRALLRPSTWILIVSAVFVLLWFSYMADRLTQLLGIDATPTNQVLSDPLRAQPGLWLVFAVLIAPAYEELLFRRVLFGRLWAAGRPWLGLVLSSVAFALVHEPPGLGAGRGWGVLVLWGVYALMGAVFAWVYRRTGSLWASYLVHAGNNLIACLALMAGP